ncbi:MAG: dienelactone hydrolase family protein [Sphingobium sp.]
MCDKFTETENERWLADQSLGRRAFTVMSGAAAVAALVPGCRASTKAAPVITPVTSQMVHIPTPDSVADAFFIHPTNGHHPAIIMWPDIAGLRDAYKEMGSRLAQAGYAVLVVNQYYRSAPAPVLSSFNEWRTDAGSARLKPMIAAITPSATTRDAAAFIDWLDGRSEVDGKRKIGTCGYCMGGPFTFRAAAVRPDRIGALASFHGGNLVDGTPDSPHLLIGKLKAAMLIAIAQNDDQREPDVKTALRTAANAAKQQAEITVYPAQHGWCTIDSPVYNREQAEMAWDRLLVTFKSYL